MPCPLELELWRNYLLYSTYMLVFLPLLSTKLRTVTLTPAIHKASHSNANTLTLNYDWDINDTNIDEFSGAANTEMYALGEKDCLDEIPISEVPIGILYQTRPLTGQPRSLKRVYVLDVICKFVTKMHALQLSQPGGLSQVLEQA